MQQIYRKLPLQIALPGDRKRSTIILGTKDGGRVKEHSQKEIAGGDNNNSSRPPAVAALPALASGSGDEVLVPLGAVIGNTWADDNGNGGGGRSSNGEKYGRFSVVAGVKVIENENDDGLGRGGKSTSTYAGEKSCRVAGNNSVTASSRDWCDRNQDDHNKTCREETKDGGDWTSSGTCKNKGFSGVATEALVLSSGMDGSCVIEVRTLCGGLHRWGSLYKLLSPCLLEVLPVSRYISSSWKICYTDTDSAIWC